METESTKPDKGGIVDKLFDKLSISALFRHVISGVVFIVGFFYCIDPVGGLTLLWQYSKDNALAYAVLSLAIGSLIYGIHRSLFNPILERIRFAFGKACNYGKESWKKGCNLWNWLIAFIRWVLVSDAIVDTTVNRWKKDPEKGPYQHFYVWGDYVQMMYTSCLSVILASWLACAVLRHQGSGCHLDSTVTAVALLLLSSGLINDLRKWYYEQTLFEENRIVLSKSHDYAPNLGS